MEITQEFIQKMQEKHTAIINAMFGLDEIDRQRELEKESESKVKPYNKGRMIIDIGFAEDGSVRTYLKDEKYPIRFYTPNEFVSIIASYKRLLAELLKSVWGILFIIFARKTLERWLFRHLELFPVRCKEEHWSEPVKELRKVLKIPQIWIDAISLILQHDMAYCYRFQDIIGELNKEEFEKSPTKELKRLANLLMDREIQGGNGMGKFRKIIPFALFIFRFIPKKKIKEMVREIDLNHIKLSKEDIYWTNIVDNYDYRGIPFEQRLKEYEQIKSVEI